MFCKNCGTQLPDGTKFCSSCGSSTDPNAPAKAPRIAAFGDKFDFPTWKILYLVAVGLMLVSMIFFFVRNMATAQELFDDYSVNYSVSGVLEGNASLKTEFGGKDVTQDGVQLIEWLEMEGFGNLTLFIYIAAVIVAGLPFIPMLKFRFSAGKLLMVKIVNIWSIVWMFLAMMFMLIEAEFEAITTPNVWGWIFILLAAGSTVLSFMVSGAMKNN